MDITDIKIRHTEAACVIKHAAVIRCKLVLNFFLLFSFNVNAASMLTSRAGMSHDYTVTGLISVRFNPWMETDDLIIF